MGIVAEENPVKYYGPIRIMESPKKDYVCHIQAAGNKYYIGRYKETFMPADIKTGAGWATAALVAALLYYAFSSKK